MVIFGIVVLGFLVLCFFYCLKKRKTACYFDAGSWFWNFVIFGLAGVLAGTVISSALGNFVVPSEVVLVETCTLEPVIVKDKEVFAVKKGQSYFYFKKGESNDCVPGIDSVLLGEKEIRFGENRRVVNKYKKTPKGKLKWFFFSDGQYSELVLLSKEDIL